MKNAYFKQKWWCYEHIMLERCGVLYCNLTIIRSWIFCMNLYEKSRVNVLLNLI